MKIVIYGESDKHGVTQATKEVLGIGSRLSKELSATLIAVCINPSQETVSDAISHGADTVSVIEDGRLTGYRPELYLAATQEFCAATDPDILLFPHTYPASDLAPRLAFRLRTRLTADCIDLSVDSDTKLLRCTKPIYGGNIIATYSSPSRPQIATVREKVFPANQADETRKGDISPFTLQSPLPTPRITSVKKVIEDYAGKKLQGAEIIICGGRGMGGQEEFNALGGLAQLLDGVLAGSRPTVEKGWTHSRFQVGLTGVRVSPKLYIAVGISGAIQHIAGVVGAKTIVAINKDPEANIFKEAHYGVKGDYRQVLPAFKECLKKYLESH
jgi:electron transfer flavoprotein alpha subunit